MSASLRLHREPEAPAAPILPETLAAEQVAEAFARLDADPTRVLRWPWSACDRLLGGLVPGSVHVVAAGTGNGKSSFLMSLMDAWATQGHGVLYLPLEIDPPMARMRWAAWRAELDVEDVLCGHWHDHPNPLYRHLPRDAKSRLNDQLVQLAHTMPVHFCPASRISASGVRSWADWGVTQFGARAVIVDHLHQLDLGEMPGQTRHFMAQAAHTLLELAKALDLVVLVAAQLNRSSDPLDAYLPPTLDRLRESSVIADVATTVVTLSRRMHRDVDPAKAAAASKSRQGIAELADPGVMQLTCRKHRLRDSARDRAALLRVRAGRVTDHSTYEDSDAYE